MRYRDKSLPLPLLPLLSWKAFCIGLMLILTSRIASCADYTFQNTEQDKRLKDLDWRFVEPAVINENGDFLSHELHYSYNIKRHKRSVASLELNYQLVDLDDRLLELVLKPNFKLYTHNLVTERRFYRNVSSETSRPAEKTAEKTASSNCYFTGHIKGEPTSTVAISTCSSLTGILMREGGHYFIEPLKGHVKQRGQPHPHILYKAVHTSTEEAPTVKPTTEQSSYCTSEEADETMREDNSRPGKRRYKRSYSKEYFVETLVVVDHSMVEYYKDEDINTYIFTIMNMVSALFHDASIGNLVNINVVKLLLLDKEQEEIEGLRITHHADKTLESFCKWQKSLNPPEPDPAHHDIAILITRLDICSRMNEPCSTLGLAQVSGMCQPGRSCNVNEDTGLALAYTIAHELGHNMPSGEKSYIMFPEFLIDAGRPLVWSNCSKDAITTFLDRDWGYCLLDDPETIYEYPYQDKPAGILYDVDHQCRLQYGRGAEYCEGIENMCTTLWCRVNNHCVTRLEPAAEGTICSWQNNTSTGVPIPTKWCFDGECIAINTRPEAIDGGWADWTDWTECSRSCGGGVSISERHCVSPTPSNGGRYCIGERKKYRICEVDPCPENQPSFLETQCSEYDDTPYKNTIYEWEPVTTNNPCQLNCKPKDMYFSVLLNDMVNDGTPCLPGTRNMCITGRCRQVGCDWRLDSIAREDRCGVCHGDGSSCTTVKDQYKGQQSLNGDGYVEATIIPAGARNIRIEEVAEANNYLAVKSESGEYYLNGHWYIQWTGNYNMAGTTVQYERQGNKEGITAAGPIKEPLHIMLLFQSHNPGVTFEYTVPNENSTGNATRKQEFSWQHLDWSHCTASCGGGHQRKKVVCTEKEAGQVDDSYCRNITKPDDLAKSCNDHLCPARWWYGPWQHCSVTCGEGGVKQRTVLCVRSLGPEEQMALDEADCEALPRPNTTEPCNTPPPPCPSLWRAGAWSECLDDCDTKTRTVTCTSSNTTACLEEIRPASQRPCNRRVTCGVWRTGIWSECSQSCGGGVKHRTVECERGSMCHIGDRAEDMLACNEFACSSADTGYRHPGRSSHNKFMNRNNEDTRSSNQRSSNMWNQLWNYMVGQKSDERIQEPQKTQSEEITYNDSWHAAEWGQCSATCGEGQKRRHVWCPQSGSCDPDVKPIHVMECEAAAQSCLSWVAGSWSQCSVSCGIGEQKRNVHCIDLTTDKAAEGCDQTVQPADMVSCKRDKCDSVSAALSTWNGEKCTEDSLALDTCEQLKGRGFCAFRYVARNCCKLCED